MGFQRRLEFLSLSGNSSTITSKSQPIVDRIVFQVYNLFSNMAELINPVPDTSKAGWKHKFTMQFPGGEILKWVANQARMGVEISYGQGPNGYDQFAIREPNGGGAVTIPYVVINDETYVGAIFQKRSFTGGYVTEVPRGFSLPNESAEETAKREFAEETGVGESLTSRVKYLGGKPVNPNESFFVANPHKNEGSKIFGLEFRGDEVELRRNSMDPRLRVYKLTSELQGEIRELDERIKPEGIRFFHVDLLRNTSEMFTQAAIAKILTAK